jgi:hypothetical protein
MGFFSKDTLEYIELFKKITTFDRVNNTNTLQEFIFNRAKSYGYTVIIDDNNNVICQSNVQHTLLIQTNYDIPKHLGYKKPPLVVEDDFKITSSRGYLGARSMSVAILLYLLSEKTPITAVFTADRYNNMKGIKSLEILDNIKYFLNLSYYKDSPIITSCAGSFIVYGSTSVDKAPIEDVKVFQATSLDNFVSAIFFSNCLIPSPSSSSPSSFWMALICSLR